APLVKEMGGAYPELAKSQAHVEKVLAKEEARFAETLDQGMEILETAIAGLDGKQIPGEVVFKLYDTYGFPVDLTADIARERGLTIDEKGFEAAMDEQRDRARAASKFGLQLTGYAPTVMILPDIEFEFAGYGGTEGSGEIVALFRDGEQVDAVAAGDEAAVILSSTPFYAESGGQIGDTGILVEDDKLFRVDDTQKSGNANVHFGGVEQGELKVGDKIEAVVDADRRQAIRLNHSATHLMHAALRQVLGDHVTQKGSLVAPDKLRFDFSHYEGVTTEQLQEIEDLVNDEIRRNIAADTDLMSYDDAIESGAMALFGEKYGDKVRVLRLGDFSIELCGGTHVDRTGDIGVFKITHEGGVASGVRRIEAVTGKGAMAWIDTNQRTLNELAVLLRSQPDQAATKVEQLMKANRELEKKLATAKHALITGKAAGHEDNITEIAGIKVLAGRMDGVDARALREAVDRAKDKLQSAVVVIGSVDEGKVRLAAGVTKNNTGKISAGDLIKLVAEQVGGKGGGRPDFAQAGGTDASKLDAALESVPAWVEQQLA
ncbi:MAG: alanine--tRNA ligase, partial [Gammaproteobacteria bacterium]|nr:alanine--tRNA ligase [Gammaproteobacteria bacterium]